VGGMPEVVRHECTGLVAPPDDPEALASAIVRLLRDRALASRLATAGRAWALQRFTASRTVDDLEALYTELAGHPQFGGLPPRAHRYRWSRSLARTLTFPRIALGVRAAVLAARASEAA